jgi:hypothetical protein
MTEMPNVRNLAAALLLAMSAVSCSSGDDGNSSTTPSTTSAGSTSTGTGGGSHNECRETMCKSDSFAIPDDTCNMILTSSCASLARTYYACELANDACKDDGTQDGAKVFEACGQDGMKLLACLGALGDGGRD